MPFGRGLTRDETELEPRFNKVLEVCVVERGRFEELIRSKTANCGPPPSSATDSSTRTRTS